MRHTNGFTLIELLVVVTIIVVLLALLVPAMDKAIYQAQLASCGAGLRGGASGVLTYAAANSRKYPYRAALGQPPAFFQPGPKYDTRPMLRPYMAINGVFNDPLCVEVDYENDGGAHGYSTRAVWFGWRYTGFKGMFRIGDRFEWAYPGLPLRRYNLLLSDLDYVQQGFQAFGSHPDYDGLMHEEAYQNQTTPRVGALGPIELSTVPNTNKFVTSRWIRDDRHERGPLDLNYAYDDGSVERFQEVRWESHYVGNDDGRIGPVPWNTTGQFGDAANVAVPWLE